MHGCLGRAVRGSAARLRRQVRGAAGQVDDAARPALDHARRERVAAAVDAEHVHLERPPPFVWVGERVIGSADARVAHEDVEVAELLSPARDTPRLLEGRDERWRTLRSAHAVRRRGPHHGQRAHAGRPPRWSG